MTEAAAAVKHIPRDVSVLIMIADSQCVQPIADLIAVTDVKINYA